MINAGRTRDLNFNLEQCLSNGDLGGVDRNGKPRLLPATLTLCEEQIKTNGALV